MMIPSDLIVNKGAQRDLDDGWWTVTHDYEAQWARMKPQDDSQLNAAREFFKTIFKLLDGPKTIAKKRFREMYDANFIGDEAMIKYFPTAVGHFTDGHHDVSNTRESWLIDIPTR